MSQKYILIIGFVLLIGVGIVLFKNSGNEQSAADALFAGFKKHCRIVEQSPFQEDTLGIRFQFNDDAVVCQVVPLIQEDNNREVEIYVWNKKAFNGSTMLGFGEGIIAKVTANPPSGLPDMTTIGTTTEVVAGESITVRTAQPLACEAGQDCPRARIVELSHKENTFVLEEYAVRANLFKSFEFLTQ